MPKIVNVFENTSAELPGLTTGLIATSDFLRDYWPLLIVGIAAVSWLAWWILQKEGITSCITGATRPEQIVENCGASGITLSDAEMARIDEIIRPATFSYDYN